MIRRNSIFRALVIICLIISFVLWEVALFEWADTIAIYFWIGLFFSVIAILSFKNGIVIPDSEKYIIEKKKQDELALKEIQVYIDEFEELDRKEEFQKQNYIKSFGKLTNFIEYHNFDFKTFTNEKIFVFENSSTIIINNKVISFSEIVSCQMKDDEQIIYENVVSNTESSTSKSSMVGRVIVGGILLGGVGAIIGGATAKKHIKSVTNPKQTNHIHNYKIHIVLNQMSEPLITLNLGSNIEKANELIAVLSIIVNRNSKN